MQVFNIGIFLADVRLLSVVAEVYTHCNTAFINKDSWFKLLTKIAYWAEVKNPVRIIRLTWCHTRRGVF